MGVYLVMIGIADRVFRGSYLWNDVDWKESKAWMLANRGTPIPGEVSVVMAIFVLPLNSALNPFLYTFNMLVEKRRKAEKAQILRRLESEFVWSQLYDIWKADWTADH
nr:hypothetical protein BaRGS_024673 [Batillaria attramentaria]